MRATMLAQPSVQVGQISRHRAECPGVLARPRSSGTRQHAGHDDFRSDIQPSSTLDQFLHRATSFLDAKNNRGAADEETILFCVLSVAGGDNA
ncbi:MAG TPA: hypothetical protein VLV78_00360 [Thermoanaerobaculia bacterium]|nr:hypothetical protein [Thermoanaerobaculia bacterium]